MAHLRTGLAGSSLVAVLVALVIVMSIVAYIFVLNPSLNPFSSRVTTTDDPAGLQLRLNVTGVIAQGDNVSIEISEFNTLRAWNDAPTTTRQSLRVSICPGLPLGVGIFQGDYSSANISSAQPLDLFYPGISGCPGYSPYGPSYVFEPNSDSIVNVSPIQQPTTVTRTVTSNGTTSVEYSVTTLIVSNTQVAASLEYSGYWTGSEIPLPSTATFHAFDPGTYTVEGVDWWGHVTFAHFQVVHNA